mmetsp:Transcript_14822/g.23157  ORF Transcript_14822/g.23157 Transcript_14822/m.23157 type:complete len:107 (-) Transcript_14822:143-463(-)
MSMSRCVAAYALALCLVLLNTVNVANAAPYAQVDPNAQHPVSDYGDMIQPEKNNVNDYHSKYVIVLDETTLLFAAIAMSVAFCVSFAFNVYLCARYQSKPVQDFKH